MSRLSVKTTIESVTLELSVREALVLQSLLYHAITFGADNEASLAAHDLYSLFATSELPFDEQLDDEVRQTVNNHVHDVLVGEEAEDESEDDGSDDLVFINAYPYVLPGFDNDEEEGL